MPIKNWLHEPFAGDTPTTDVHATDPARLKKEIETDLGVRSPMGSINNTRPEPDPVSGIQSSKNYYMRKEKK